MITLFIVGFFNTFATEKEQGEKLRQQQQSGECHSHINAETPKMEQNKKNPDGVIVLGVSIHCEGCRDEVLRCLRGFEGSNILILL